MASSLARVDHLVYAAPDLEAAVERFERLTGVAASAGGRHPGRGTRNAMLRLGPRRYLELIGPDRDQPPPGRPRWFGLDTLTEGLLISWASGVTGDLRSARASALAAGAPVGPEIEGRRTRSDGVELSWVMTEPQGSGGVEVVPFLIDWGTTPHPADSATGGIDLISLRVEHPDRREVERWFGALGVPIAVGDAHTPAIVALLSTPRGRLELR